MAEKTTFIKIDRNIINWRWFHNPNTVVVFLYLLIKANVKSCDFENITIERGQFATSLATISRETGLTVRQVRTAISHLKSTGEVTSKTYPKFSLFSIVNYDSYQSSATSKVTSNRQGSDKQVTSNRQQYKNEKNNKNVKKKEINKESASPPPLRGAAREQEKYPPLDLPELTEEQKWELSIQ